MFFMWMIWFVFFILCITSDSSGGVYNVGGGPHNAISLLEVLDIVQKNFPLGKSVQFKDWRPSDQKVYYTDLSKIMKEMGWKPTISYNEGITALVQWYNDNRILFEKYYGITE